ncbi:hypothetical protein FHG87_002574 [Trinorchestia longiramus]|nr:hypothetical protein FHG87_002574 [Trinorchestia longiramus]
MQLEQLPYDCLDDNEGNLDMTSSRTKDRIVARTTSRSLKVFQLDSCHRYCVDHPSLKVWFSLDVSAGLKRCVPGLPSSHDETNTSDLFNLHCVVHDCGGGAKRPYQAHNAKKGDAELATNLQLVDVQNKDLKRSS